MTFLDELILPTLRDLAAQSIKASLLAGVVALLCLLPRRWLSSPWRHLLWGAVFARLVLPDVPVPGWSWNVSRLLPEPTVSAVFEKPAVVAASPVGEAQASNTMAELSPLLPPLSVQGREVETRNLTPAAPRQVISPSQAPLAASLSWWSLFGIAWLAGAVVWWLALAVSWWRFRRRVVARCQPASAQMQALFDACMEESGVRTRMRLACSEHIATPAVCGVVRPVVLMPQALESSLPAHELRMLFLHELGHVKRHDTLVQVLASLLLGLHWWNPVLWLTWSRLRHEAEAATDAWVLQRMEPDTAPSYGAMLLSLATRACGVSVSLFLMPSLIGAASQGRRLRQRLTAIVGHRPARRWASVLGVCALFILAMTGFSQEAPAAKGGRALTPAEIEAKLFPRESEPKADPTNTSKPKANPASTADPGDLYLESFQSFKIAEKLEHSGDKTAAFKKYREAHTTLKEVAKGHPGWQSQVVAYRLKALEQALSRLGVILMAPPAPVPVAATAPEPAKPASNVEASNSGDTIGGVVVDDKGQPIADAEVEVEVRPVLSRFSKSVLPAGYRSPFPVKTDATGRWQIQRVPAGVVLGTSASYTAGQETYRLYVTHPEFLTLAFADETPGADARFRDGKAKIAMERGVVLRGTVRDDDGLGVPGAVIQRNLTAKPHGDPDVVADAVGRYQVRNARLGDLVVCVRAPGLAPQVQAIKVAAETTQDFALKKGQVLTMKFVDEKDSPVPRVFVTIRPPGKDWMSREPLWKSPESGADGIIVWEEAPAGDLAADVAGIGITSFTKSVIVGGENVIKLTAENRLPSVTLKVTDAATGASLAGCTFETGTALPSGVSMGPFQWMTRDMGIYMRAGSVEGEYTGTVGESLLKYGLFLAVRHEGYMPAMTPLIDTKSGDATLSVALEKGQPVEIIVRDQGNAAGEAQVLVNWGQNLFSFRDFAAAPGSLGTDNLEFVGKTDADGRCTLPPCVGDAAVLVTHANGFVVTTFADLVRDPMVRLGLYAKVEASVKKGGKPVPDAKYQFSGSYELPGGRTLMQTLTAVSDAQGRISLPRVIPVARGMFREPTPPAQSGRGRAYGTASSLGSKAVSAGMTTTFELEVKEPDTRTVTGRFVVQGGGAPVPPKGEAFSARLGRSNAMLGRSMLGGSAMLDREGRFTFDGVQPGDYSIQLSPGIFKPHGLSLADGKPEFSFSVPAPTPDTPAKPIDLGDLELVEKQ